MFIWLFSQDMEHNVYLLAFVLRALKTEAERGL